MAQALATDRILNDLYLLLGRTADEWSGNLPFLAQYGQKTIGRAYQIGDVATYAAQLRAEDPEADENYRGLLRWADRFVAAQK